MVLGLLRQINVLVFIIHIVLRGVVIEGVGLGGNLTGFFLVLEGDRVLGRHLGCEG